MANYEIIRDFLYCRVITYRLVSIPMDVRLQAVSRHVGAASNALSRSKTNP